MNKIKSMLNYKMVVGSRAQVMHGTADKTSGGLTAKDLKYNKNGKIVSRKKSASAKKDNRLVKAGYTTKRGTFGAVKVDDNKRRSSSKGARRKTPNRSSKRSPTRKSSKRGTSRRSARRSSPRRVTRRA